MADLDLKELDRLEREMQGKVISTNMGKIHEQLRPLLDLVERMGEALSGLVDWLDPAPSLAAEAEFEVANEALDDYRRAKGEKR